MAQNIEEFRNSIPVGDLGIIPLQSCSELGKMVNEYIVDWRKEREDVLHQDDKIKDSYIVNTKCSRFGSGEAKGTILDSIRGKDLYLLVDVTNYSIEYSLCGHMNKMSPDDHYSDLKRIITAEFPYSGEITFENYIDCYFLKRYAEYAGWPSGKKSTEWYPTSDAMMAMQTTKDNDTLRLTCSVYLDMEHFLNIKLNREN